MRVKNVYTPSASTCRPESTLAEVASVMWECDCGAIPVVNEEGKPCGVITDRDICMALATRDRLASSTKVREVITGKTFVCSKEDRLEDALETMSREQVRRLPVLDGEGRVAGILSLNDAILNLDVPSSGERIDPVAVKVLKTLQSVCAHRQEVVSAP